jgi:hypothetical protein
MDEAPVAGDASSASSTDMRSLSVRQVSGTRHLYVKLAQDDDGYPPYTSEELDATSVGEDVWAIDRAPVWAHGISRGDIVRVQRDHDSSLWITDIVEPSSNWCARVMPRGEVRDSCVVDRSSNLGQTSGPLGSGWLLWMFPAMCRRRRSWMRFKMELRTGVGTLIWASAPTLPDRACVGLLAGLVATCGSAALESG